jgi:hypothetical protein
MLYCLLGEEEPRMSLYALPVSVSDLTALQQGIQFFTNVAEAATEAAAVNATGSIRRPQAAGFILARPWPDGHHAHEDRLAAGPGSMMAVPLGQPR